MSIALPTDVSAEAAGEELGILLNEGATGFWTFDVVEGGIGKEVVVEEVVETVGGTTVGVDNELASFIGCLLRIVEGIVGGLDTLDVVDESRLSVRFEEYHERHVLALVIIERYSGCILHLVLLLEPLEILLEVGKEVDEATIVLLDELIVLSLHVHVVFLLLTGLAIGLILLIGERCPEGDAIALVLITESDEATDKVCRFLCFASGHRAETVAENEELTALEIFHKDIVRTEIELAIDSEFLIVDVLNVLCVWIVVVFHRETNHASVYFLWFE